MKHHETDLEIWEIGQAQPAKIGEAPLMENSTYQFACPQCGLVLQALLKTELTSVQCGECMDVFDVQMPSSAAGAPDDASSSCAPSGRMNGAAQSHEDGPPSKRRAVDTSANDTPSATSPPEGGIEDESTSNLEASLKSCTAHRERILQMLNDDPDNSNLKELRDQLTNAINQLQGTKTMVQRAAANQGGLASAPGGDMRNKDREAHSSRKNKPQRCSVCGGIGHKSRTCSMAVQQPHPGSQPPHMAPMPQCYPGGAPPMQPQFGMPPFGGSQMPQSMCAGYMAQPSGAPPGGGPVAVPGAQGQMRAFCRRPGMPGAVPPSGTCMQMPGSCGSVGSSQQPRMRDRQHDGNGWMHCSPGSAWSAGLQPKEESACEAGGPAAMSARAEHAAMGREAMGCVRSGQDGHRMPGTAKAGGDDRA